MRLCAVAQVGLAYSPGWTRMIFILCSKVERKYHLLTRFGLFQVVRRWMPLKSDDRCDLEVVIVANHIRVINARMQGLTITPELKDEFSQFWAAHEAVPFTARNKILASVCPQVRAPGMRHSHACPYHVVCSVAAAVRELGLMCVALLSFALNLVCYIALSLRVSVCFRWRLCRCTVSTSSSSRC